MIKLILFSASLLIFSCNDEDSPGDPDAGGSDTSNIQESDLEGTWTMVERCESYEGSCNDEYYDEGECEGNDPPLGCHIDGCVDEGDEEFDVIYTFANNIVTTCTPSGSYCDDEARLEFGAGDLVSVCDIDVGCNDMNTDECNSYGDPCVVIEDGCYYWSDVNPSETYIPSCNDGTIELSDGVLIISATGEFDGCTQTETRTFILN